MEGGDHENYNYQWRGGGVIGVLQSLLGGLGHFYCDIIKISPSPLPPRHFNPRWWIMTGAQEGLHETSVDVLYAAKIKSVKGVLCWIKVKVLLASTWDRGPPQLRGIYKIHSFGNFFLSLCSWRSARKKSIWFVALANSLNGMETKRILETYEGGLPWMETN